MKKNARKIRGQGTVEWILILFVLVGFVLIFGSTLKKRIGGLVDQVFTTVDSNVGKLSSPNP